MAFQSLYRKYRPQRFAEMVGQEHVTTALRNAVREGRVGHAYLFSGPRGTGKTTTARILAKALNCLDLGADGEPCCKCENCVAIAKGTFNDLVEMDAASNRGVDDARDLVARISLGLGATSKRKVYILDEAHMLTPAAANTLLKTLEEPPAHVVFALATTEPEKLLPTIRSRTQHFALTLLDLGQLTGLLGSLLEREGIGYEPEALAVVARAGAGSARDAESLLDQALAHSADGLTAAEVAAVLGGSPFDARVAILDAIAAEDVAGGLAGLAALLDAGHDPRRVAEDLLRSLRDAFLLVAARGRVRIDAPEEEQARLQTTGEALGNAALVRALETLGQAIVDMRGTDAADPRLVLEIALVRLARRDTGGPLQTLADRVERLEKRLADGGGPTPAVSAAVADPPATPPGKKAALGALKRSTPAAVPDPERTPDPPAPPAAAAPSRTDATEVAFTLDDVILAWDRVLDGVPRSLRSAIQDAQPLRIEGNVVVFGVARSQIDVVKPRFHKEAHAIREAFIAELGAPPRFKFATHEWTGDDGPRRRKPTSVPNEEAVSPPEADDPAIDLVDPEELVDAPPVPSAAVDSISRLEDAFGATVVEERPRT